MLIVFACACDGVPIVQPLPAPFPDAPPISTSVPQGIKYRDTVSHV